METTKEYIQKGWEPVSDYVIDLIDKTKYEFIKDDNGISYCRNKQENVTESKQKRLKILEQTYTQIPKGWTPIPEDKVELYKKEGYTVKLFGDLGYAAKERDPKKEWYYVFTGTDGKKYWSTGDTKEDVQKLIQALPTGGETLVWKEGQTGLKMAKEVGLAPPEVPKEPEKEKTLRELFENIPCVTMFDVVENIKFPGYPVQSYYRSQVNLKGKTTYAYFTSTPAGKLADTYVAIIQPDINGETRATYKCSGDAIEFIKGSMSQEVYQVKPIGYTKEDLTQALSVVSNYNETFGLDLYQYNDVLDTQVIDDATEIIAGYLADNYRSSAFNRFLQLLKSLRNYYKLTGNKETENFLNVKINYIQGIIDTKYKESGTVGYQRGVQKENRIVKEQINLADINAELNAPSQTDSKQPQNQIDLAGVESEVEPYEIGKTSYAGAAKTAQMTGYNVLTTPVGQERASYDKVSVSDSPFTKGFTVYKFKYYEPDSDKKFEDWSKSQKLSYEKCVKILNILYSAARQKSFAYNDNRLSYNKQYVCGCSGAGLFKKKDEEAMLNYLGNTENEKWKIDCTALDPSQQPKLSPEE